VVHHDELEGSGVQTLASARIGVYLFFWIVTAFYVLFGLCAYGSGLLFYVFKAVLFCDFYRGRGTRPLKKVGIAMPVLEISELPYPCIFFIDGLRHFVKNEGCPGFCSVQVLMSEAVIRKQGE